MKKGSDGDNSDVSLDSLFADDFPIDIEREKKTAVQSQVVFPTPVSIGKTIPSLVVDAKTKGKSLRSETGLEYVEQSPTENQHQLFRKKQVHIDDQRSSVMDYTFKESRFIKTLKEISLRKKLFPLLKLNMFTIFLVILFMISLASVNFTYSRKSTKEVERGVEIVNQATVSIVNIEKSWGWTLFLFASAIGIGLFSSDQLVVLREAVIGDIALFAGANTNLKLLLSNLNAQSFLEDTFQKNIAMYNIFGISMIKDEYDIFTATDVLINKYLSMMQYNSVLELALRDDLIFNLNNTSNDYMVQSNNLISKTEDFLQSLITENLTNLKIILISQSLALVMLSILLITMSLIVIRAYRKLFQVLVKIREESVASQISQLEKVQKYFYEEEIEHNTFIQASYDMFEDSRPVFRKKGKLNTNLNNGRRGQTFDATRQNLYLIGLSAASLIFIPLLIGLFCGSLIGSMSSFRSFEEVKNQMGVLSAATYQSNMFLYSFGYTVIFGSYPTMLIQNMNPAVQLAENLELFSDLNNKLTQFFLKQDNLDPVILDILKSNVCPYLPDDPTIQYLCEIATKNGLIGLISINAAYLDISNFYITQFMQNPTPQNAAIVSGGYITDADPVLSTMNYAYPFMIDHIMGKFSTMVDDSLNDEVAYFVGVCITIVFTALFIYFFSIRKLREADLSRRKILKIIPFNVFQENRILSFYLKVHFRDEVETIKNIL